MYICVVFHTGTPSEAYRVITNSNENHRGAALIDTDMNSMTGRQLYREQRTYVEYLKKILILATEDHDRNISSLREELAEERRSRLELKNELHEIEVRVRKARGQE